MDDTEEDGVHTWDNGTKHQYCEQCGDCILCDPEHYCPDCGLCDWKCQCGDDE